MGALILDGFLGLGPVAAAGCGSCHRLAVGFEHVVASVVSAPWPADASPVVSATVREEPVLLAAGLPLHRHVPGFLLEGNQNGP